MEPPKPNSHLSISNPILLLLIVIFLLIPFDPCSAQLSPSQSRTLLRLQRLFEYPPVLAGWNNYTNFCYLPTSTSLSVTCSGNRITGLSIVGDKPNSPSSPNTLPSTFSTESLFITLSKLPSLSALSLISLGIWGPLPTKINRLSSLQVLNLSSNYFYGLIPFQISSLTGLQSLVLGNNSFNGTVPDLRSLSVLDELDLDGNLFGPEFPSLGKSIVSLVLKNNVFQANIPMNLRSFDQLQRLDVSSNRIVGSIPSFLFSLPSIQYLEFSGNRLNGALPVDLSCGNVLQFVDLSRNLLTGRLPSCIRSNSSSRIVLNSWNCLSSGDSRFQHQSSYCNEGPLAAVLPHRDIKDGSKSMLGLILGIVGGIVGAVMVLGLLLLVVLRRARAKNAEGNTLKVPVAGKATVQVSPRRPAETRHMSQAVRLGTLGLTPYRVFNMEELEEATNNFDPSNLVEEGSQGQFYKGWLEDGSMVLVRCLKLKQKHSPQSLLQYMDVISKLRHLNLVSILGHCTVSGQDNATTTNIYLVSEYVSNGTLRSHITEWRRREMLKWPQRVAAVIGVARGIQFLHTVTVPGIVGNDLRIENILLDETLTAKIRNYNLPVLPKNKNNKVGSESPFNAVEESELGSIRSLEHGEKEDVYQLGLILLEVITGKSVEAQSELDMLKRQLQKSLTEGPTKLRGFTDPAIRNTFAYDSLRTAVEIALNCVSKDYNERPSLDDVLWNLQYSVQIQDGWASSENLSTQF